MTGPSRFPFIRTAATFLGLALDIILVGDLLSTVESDTQRTPPLANAPAPAAILILDRHIRT